jgi:membrane associated rhomboid family serine protease
MGLSITLIIVIITCIISFSAFSNQKLTDDLIFYPPSVKRGQFYRFFTCGLIHADIGHLIFNMLSLYLFGEIVEKRFIEVFGKYGNFIYLGMYLLALAASLLPTYSKNKDNYHYRSLGASGAVSAVVFAGILFYPLVGIGLFFIPIFIAGFIFGFLYLAISSWMDKRGGDNINHSAHIFGALFGVGFTIIACQTFADYPVLQSFIDMIKNADPSSFIQFGRN